MVFEDIEVVIKKLYKYCLRLSGSPWTAEDLVQETILKVYKIKKQSRKGSLHFLIYVRWQKISLSMRQGNIKRVFYLMRIFSERLAIL
ncbi:sigma factor [Niallia circulans]